MADLRSFALIEPYPTDRFERLRGLSRCLFGVVYVCRDRLTGSEVAIKRIPNDKLMRCSPNTLEDPLAEAGTGLFLASVSELSSEYIVRTLGVFQDELHSYIMTEYRGGVELFESAACRRGVTEEEARGMARAVLNAVRHLHALGLAHRDLSMENTLVYPDGSFKILDFGQAVGIFSKNLNKIKYKGKAGKPYYRAPETSDPDGYYPEGVDVFAVGVMIFIAAVGSPPWQEAQISDRRFALVKDHGVEALLSGWGKFLSPLLIDLLECMLKADPEKRANLNQVLNHPWMHGPCRPWTI